MNEDLYSKLSGSQKSVARFVLDKLQVERQQIILLEGLIGVGKSLVIEAIRDDIERHGGKIIEPYTLTDTTLSNPVRKGPVISTATPWEAYHIATSPLKEYSDWTYSTFVVKGMSLAETTALIGSIGIRNELLSLDEIARYSMGIPLLAHVLSYGQLASEYAKLIAAQHLKDSLPDLGTTVRLPTKAELRLDEKALPEFLDVLPTQEVLQIAKRLDRLERTHIYQGLEEVLRRMHELERKGIREESPLFIDPESVNIYNQMLRKTQWPNVRFYVPNLDRTTFSKIAKSIGIEEEGNYFTIELRNGTRVAMFYRDAWTSVRKEIMAVVLPNGVVFSNDFFNPNRMEAWMEEMKEKHKSYGFKPTTKAKGISILFMSADHEGLYHNPVTWGWLMESMLQQRAIHYFAFNAMLNMHYAYMPKERKLVLL